MDNTKNQQTPEWYALFKRIDYIRSSATRSKHRQELANIRKGISPTTEHYAYPYILPFTNTKDSKVILRVAALMAEFTEIPQLSSKEKVNLGKIFYQVSAALHHQRSNTNFQPDPKQPDTIAIRLKNLHTMDFENAVQVIHTLLKIMSQSSVSFDFYKLADILLRWGNGYSEESLQVRTGILRDYYRSTIATTNDNSK